VLIAGSDGNAVDEVFGLSACVPPLIREIGVCGPSLRGRAIYVGGEGSRRARGVAGHTRVAAGCALFVDDHAGLRIVGSQQRKPARLTSTLLGGGARPSNFEIDRSTRSPTRK